MSAHSSSSQPLAGRRIAVLASNGVEQVELTQPVKGFREAGADVTVISPDGNPIQGFNHDKPGDTLPVDQALSQAKPDQFDALLLPGGVANPDTLRTLPGAVAFVRGFTDRGKPVAAICHGPWTLIETGFVRGKTLTSWPSLKTDLTNAGATWVDQQVAVDGNLVTSRKPDDIPAFTRAAIELIGAAAQRKAA
jgi:protease I